MEYHSHEHPALKKRTGVPLEKDGSDDVASQEKERVKEEQYRASIAVNDLWEDKYATMCKYRLLVFFGFLFTGFSSLAFLICGTIFVISQGVEYIRTIAILFISVRAFLFLMTALPHVFYSMDLDASPDHKEREALSSFIHESPVLLNPVWYLTPGYLYDIRDTRNRRDVVMLFTTLIMATIVVIAVLAHSIHRVNGSADIDYSYYDTTTIEAHYSITAAEAVELIREYELMSYLLPVIGMLCTVSVYEAFTYFASVHAFQRSATPPSLSVTKLSKKRQ